MGIVKRRAYKIVLAVIAIAAANQKYWQAALIYTAGTSGLTQIARDLTRRSDSATAVGIVGRGSGQG